VNFFPSVCSLCSVEMEPPPRRAAESLRSLIGSSLCALQFRSLAPPIVMPRFAQSISE
jgi:hypothetical protein